MNTPVIAVEAVERVRSRRTHAPEVVLSVAYFALATAAAMAIPTKWVVALLLTCAVAFALCAAAAIHRRVVVSTSSVVFWALVFRSPFVIAQPTLSDDVWRYLWDGKVAVAGINPYSYAPDDPVLTMYRDEIWSRVNHRSIPTVYPPYAQALFRLASSHGGLVAWKLMCVGFDLAVVAALAAALHRQAGGATRLLLYAWNPLVIVEFAWSGHVDAAAVAFCTAAIVAAQKRRNLIAVALTSIAAGIKLFPALLLPALLRRARSRIAWTIPAAVAAVGLLPYLSSGIPAWFTGLRQYARTWEFNSLPYSTLTTLATGPVQARLILGALLALAVSLLTVRRHEPQDVAVGVLGACVALSPTVHPWYVTWALPAAILSDRPPRLACLAASVAVLLSYRVLTAREATGVWLLPRPWLLLEWGLVMVVSAGEWLTHPRACDSSTTAQSVG